MKHKNIFVSLDIGTSKICMIVASPDKQNRSIKILGIGIGESEGLSRGVVTNIERTANTIKKVKEQAEQQSGIDITEVTVGIAGDHIECIQTRGLVGISNPSLEISKRDVDRLLEEASRINLSADRKIIHVIPQDFVIDSQDGITDPIGMSGVRLEANVNVITAMNTAIQNIHRCVEKAGLKVLDVVLEPVASSVSVLNDEEKEVGVALIDIGGGTTDIAIFEEGVLRFTSVFGLAGRHVTDDVRKVLGIVANEAEKVKRIHGHCHLASLMRDDVIMIPGVAGRQPLEIYKSYLTQIIEARMTELFEFAAKEIYRSGYSSRLGAGIVLTGGTTLLAGTENLAREVFGTQVKIGIPSGISYAGLAPEVESPVYATSVGLVLFSMPNFDDLEDEIPEVLAKTNPIAEIKIDSDSPRDFVEKSVAAKFSKDENVSKNSNSNVQEFEEDDDELELEDKLHEGFDEDQSNSEEDADSSSNAEHKKEESKFKLPKLKKKQQFSFKDFNEKVKNFLSEL